MNDLFFQLIRIALGNQEELKKVPSAEEWGRVFSMAKKQSLVGICFSGVQRITNSEEDEYCGMPEYLFLKWMGMAAGIQQNNLLMNEYSQAALAYFRKAGYPCQELKGQGLARCYGDLASLRDSGDVDVWLNITRKELYALSRKEFGKVEGVTYHHIHYPIFKNCEVEAHLYPSFLSSPYRNMAMKRFCAGFQPVSGCEDRPSLAFNRVFILLHCYRHFCGHGMGLRQLMDYYFVLKNGFTETERKESLRWIERLGMMKFCKATMWLMQRVFGLEETYLLCEPDEKNGVFLLKEVLRSGAFTFGEENTRIEKSAAKRYLHNLKRDIRTIRICPHESLWDPMFNVYQFFMSKFVWKA